MVEESTVAKFTPGPWTFYTKPQPNGCPIVGARGLMIAMLAHSVHDPRQCETAEANARLIAAAPDLLAALRRMIQIADILADKANCGVYDAEIRAARFVVADATGFKE